MASVVADAKSAASWIADALSSSGYRADFSPQSLWEVDRFLAEQSRHRTCNGTLHAVRHLCDHGVGMPLRQGFSVPASAMMRVESASATVYAPEPDKSAKRSVPPVILQVSSCGGGSSG